MLRLSQLKWCRFLPKKIRLYAKHTWYNNTVFLSIWSATISAESSKFFMWDLVEMQGNTKLISVHLSRNDCGGNLPWCHVTFTVELMDVSTVFFWHYNLQYPIIHLAPQCSQNIKPPLYFRAGRTVQVNTYSGSDVFPVHFRNAHMVANGSNLHENRCVVVLAWRWSHWVNCEAVCKITISRGYTW